MIPRMPLRPLLLVLVNAFVLTVVGTADDVPYFADNGFDNSIPQIQHPCGEHYRGKTFVAYQGPHEDAYVCAYDHSCKKWQGPVLAGISALGQAADPLIHGVSDNHGKPAIIVDTKGYVHLVFGAHGGDPSLGENLFGLPGRGKQTHVVTTKPEDISSWQVLENIDPFGTYSQFVKMESGDLYLFYRHGSHCSDWVYQRSIDDGQTFAPPVSVLKSKPQADDPNVRDSWYAWFTKGKDESIIVMYVYHPCRAVGHTNQRSNVYYMKMNSHDSGWENVSGHPLTLPVTKEHADQHTLVVESGKTRCNHGICRVDETGAPHILFQYDKGHAYYTRWLGNSWQTPTGIADGAGSLEGDMIVESSKEIRLLLSGNNDGRGSEICWWNTIDGGHRWNRGAIVVSSEKVAYNLGTFIRNFHPDGQMLIEERDPKAPNLYRKMFLWGASGMVGRSTEEAAKMAERLASLIAAQPNNQEGRDEQARKAERKRAKKAGTLVNE